MSTETELAGGVVFRVGDERWFLPAAIACKVLPMPGVARVPGAPVDLVGIALVEGETVPVVAIGDLDTRGSRRPSANGRPRADNRPLLVCDVHGEHIALVGLEILATGFFPPAEHEPAEASDPAGLAGVVHEGAVVRPFDVGAVASRLREGRWAV